MKLSVFPEALAHPKDKATKNKESKMVSYPYLPEVRDIVGEEDLIITISNFAWSPFVFSGKRHADNFVSCDFLTFDIDENMRIDEAETFFKSRNLCALCLPSPSHTDENHRFRLVIPLAKTIYNRETYSATWLELAEQLKVVDEQCKDLARFYFGSTVDAGFYQDGDLLLPKDPAPVIPQSPKEFKEIQILVSDDIKDMVRQIYGRERDTVPESVEFFIKNASTGLDGLWTNSLNSFAFSLSLSGVDDNIIEQVAEQLAPEPLDKRDLYQIERACRDGRTQRNNMQL
jgi:hypothetical protein